MFPDSRSVVEISTVPRGLIIFSILTFCLATVVWAEPPSVVPVQEPAAEDATIAGLPDSDEPTAILKMQFVHVGQLPNRPGRVMGGFGLIADESLLVNPANGGIKNIFVFAYTGRRGVVLPAFKPERKKVVLNIRNGRYEPRALIARVGDTLQVHNRGPGLPNPNLQFFNNQIPVGANRNPNPNVLLSMELTSPEPAPIPAACNIFPWMSATILVVDHPFAAVTDDDGVMTIEGLPVGQELVFRAAHEEGSFKGPLRFQGKDVSWRANKFELTLKPGVNDFGKVELDWSNL